MGYRFPDYPLPPGETTDSYLRILTYAGAREKWGAKLDERTRRQLEHELSVIEQLKLAGYFLIVWDIVQFCRESRIMVQGRGSAANSAVCYALGITAVDAINMDLLFERFLSEERGEWPDIDLDLPSGDEREQVIQYVYRRYGDRGAAMTANVITYRTKSAVREVGKVLGFTAEQVDRLAKLNQVYEFRDRHDDIVELLRRGGIDAEAPRILMLVDLVRRIQNAPRHLGQHSGGMVIAAQPLDEIVSLEPATMPGRVVLQWDKDDCADLGIIKIDLLGLGMLAVLEEAIATLHERQGVGIDLAHLPPDDPDVYAMLRRADTVGVFQIESRAQMATLPRMKPERFYDLVVEVAIIRPGPIVGKMVHPYLDRRNGRAPVTYPHPALEPILRRTLGVPLFQEQLLRIAMAVGGFTGGEAEELRRAMGFKRSVERMQKIDARLRAGMLRNGISGALADSIARSITSFALYGFPESHAASFAFIAYASAYLKCHYSAAFFAAMLNCYPLGFYHPSTLVKDAERRGVLVLPIDVAVSDWNCTLEPHRLRRVSEKSHAPAQRGNPIRRRMAATRRWRHGDSRPSIWRAETAERDTTVARLSLAALRLYHKLPASVLDDIRGLRPMSHPTQIEKAETFRKMHDRSRILVLPNAWDAASALIFEEAGFKAIATTSSGVANSLGYPDGQVIPRSEMLFVIGRIARSVSVPVTADIEAGYADDLATLGETIRMVIEAGAIGINLEDSMMNRGKPLLDLETSVERVRAARQAAMAAGVPIVINARTDVFLHGIGEREARFDEAVRRVNAYRAAGADSLFVPGVRNPDVIGKLAAAITGPLNILAGPGTPSVSELEKLGVARVSVGGGPARGAMTATRRVARELLDHGTYNTFVDDVIAHPDANKLMLRNRATPA